ncbi:MAG: glycosyltransferase family 4 protein [Lentimicrobiaceae bacterium]|nr:glycosyltransferase family 4 protein [Lentimicrobiaceae bacterium]
MRKVLIISYYWPPSGGAGVQRWLKFAKYLREFGWEPVIYTPENPEYPAIDDSLQKDIPEGLTVIKTPIWEPYRFYSKFIGARKDERINAGFLSEKKKPGLAEHFSIWLRGNFFIPDARKFWIKPSVKFLTEYLRAHPVDAIISTGPPHSMHMIALGLKQKTGLPWLADFRDPWTNIDFYHELKLSGRADRKHHLQELSVLKNANEVVVISPSMRTDFIKLHNRPYSIITNGFDTDDIGTVAVETDRKFSVSHIGTMVKTRNPEALWLALKAEAEENQHFADDLEIKLAGSVDISVTESLEKHGLISFVNRINYLPHNEVIKLQQQSQVLLLLINDTPNAKVILPGKFFEYMAAHRPILCIGPADGDAASVISETKSGFVAEKDDVEAIRHAIKTLYKGFREGKPAIDSTGIEQFSRRALTARMAGLLHQLVG